MQGLGLGVLVRLVLVVVALLQEDGLGHSRGPGLLLRIGICLLLVEALSTRLAGSILFGPRTLALLGATALSSSFQSELNNLHLVLHTLVALRASFLSASLA